MKRNFLVTLTVDLDHVDDVDDFDSYSISDDLHALCQSDYPFTDFTTLAVVKGQPLPSDRAAMVDMVTAYLGTGEPDEHLRDMLTDLRHYADKHSLNFHDELQHSEMAYGLEKSEHAADLTATLHQMLEAIGFVPVEFIQGCPLHTLNLVDGRRIIVTDALDVSAAKCNDWKVGLYRQNADDPDSCISSESETTDFIDALAQIVMEVYPQFAFASLDEWLHENWDGIDGRLRTTAIGICGLPDSAALRQSVTRN